MLKNFILILILVSFSSFAHAKLNVVASTADIRAITHAVGGDMIELTAIAKGTQDPHYIEAKPSFMVKMRDADLLVAKPARQICLMPVPLIAPPNPTPAARRTNS